MNKYILTNIHVDIDSRDALLMDFGKKVLKLVTAAHAGAFLRPVSNISF